MTEQHTSIAEVGLTEVEGTPRCRDLELAERLGFDRPRDIRKIIQRHEAELAVFGICATVAQNTGKRGRPSAEYWLNEEQALLVSVVSGAPNAPAVRSMLIKVFVAWRRGHLPAVEGEIAAIGADARKVFGGIVKSIVHHELTAIIPAMVEAAVVNSQFGVTRDHVTAGQVADLANVPPKGRRGLIRVVSNGLRWFCARNNIAPREGILGAKRAYVFPMAICRDWLEHEGREKIKRYMDRKAGQGVFKLVQPKRDEKDERPL